MSTKPLSFLAGVLAAVIFLASCAQHSKTLSSPISFAQDDKPYSIAIMKLKGMGISEIEAETLTETLYDSISQILLEQAPNLKEKYSLLERSQMDKILDQFQLQDALCSDDSCAVTFGRILSVQRIIIGSVGLVGETYIISCRIVDVESSKVVRSSSRKYQGKIDGVLDILPLVGNELLTGVRLLSPIQPSPSQPVETQPSRPSDSFINSLGIKMVQIPGGTFQMGSLFEDDPRNPFKGKGNFKDEQPVHSVTLSAFEMSATEITQGQYMALMGTNPSRFTGDDNLPVESVSWNDAVAFCRALSLKTGSEYRLPTEAEWEYACRAGTSTKYYTGNSESDLARAGWYDGNSGMKTHPVGQKTPNAWGLYDMHGNVFEYCNDWYWSYTSENVTNPTGAKIGVFRVLRGGSWYSIDDFNCRSAYRIGLPGFGDNRCGFRVVRRP